MALEPKTFTVNIGQRTWILTRPGRGGVARVSRRIANATDNGMGMPSGVLADLDGRGLEMEAILAEYITVAPHDWFDVDEAGKHKKSPDGRNILDFEKVDADEFGQVGEEALAFHATFRDTDRRFSLAGGQRP